VSAKQALLEAFRSFREAAVKEREAWLSWQAALRDKQLADEELVKARELEKKAK
jgi:hypothetical protein